MVELAIGKSPFRTAASAIYAVCVTKEYPKFPKHFTATAHHFLDRCLQENPKERADCPELLQHSFVLNSTPPESDRDLLDNDNDNFTTSNNDSKLESSNRRHTRSAILHSPPKQESKYYPHALSDSDDSDHNNNRHNTSNNHRTRSSSHHNNHSDNHNSDNDSNEESKDYDNDDLRDYSLLSDFRYIQDSCHDNSPRIKNKTNNNNDNDNQISSSSSSSISNKNRNSSSNSISNKNPNYINDAKEELSRKKSTRLLKQSSQYQVLDSRNNNSNINRYKDNKNDNEDDDNEEMYTRPSTAPANLTASMKRAISMKSRNDMNTNTNNANTNNSSNNNANTTNNSNHFSKPAIVTVITSTIEQPVDISINDSRLHNHNDRYGRRNSVNASRIEKSYMSNVEDSIDFNDYFD